MHGKPIINASTTITLKRKRSPVWPFSTRPVLEQALAILIDKGTVQELSPPTNGESIPRPRQEAPDFNMSGAYGALTTWTSGSSSRSDNMLKTPLEQLPGPALRVDMSSPSIPTSPNYFDLLHEVEQDPVAATPPPRRWRRRGGST